MCIMICRMNGSYYSRFLITAPMFYLQTLSWRRLFIRIGLQSNHQNQSVSVKELNLSSLSFRSNRHIFSATKLFSSLREYFIFFLHFQWIVITNDDVFNWVQWGSSFHSSLTICTHVNTAFLNYCNFFFTICYPQQKSHYVAVGGWA